MGLSFPTIVDTPGSSLLALEILGVAYFLANFFLFVVATVLGFKPICSL
jgi:hypothetical protein